MISSRRGFLKSACGAVFDSALSAQEPNRPNIVLIWLTTWPGMPRPIASQHPTLMQVMTGQHNFRDRKAVGVMDPEKRTSATSCNRKVSKRASPASGNSHRYNPPDCQPEWRRQRQTGQGVGFDEYCSWHAGEPGRNAPDRQPGLCRKRERQDLQGQIRQRRLLLLHQQLYGAVSEEDEFEQHPFKKNEGGKEAERTRKKLLRVSDKMNRTIHDGLTIIRAEALPKSVTFCLSGDAFTGAIGKRLNGCCRLLAARCDQAAAVDDEQVGHVMGLVFGVDDG